MGNKTEVQVVRPGTHCLSEGWQVQQSTETTTTDDVPKQASLIHHSTLSTLSLAWPHTLSQHHAPRSKDQYWTKLFGQLWSSSAGSEGRGWSASGSQPWLHNGITWGAFKSGGALWIRLRHRYSLKSLQVTRLLLGHFLQDSFSRQPKPWTERCRPSMKSWWKPEMPKASVGSQAQLRCWSLCRTSMTISPSSPSVSSSPRALGRTGVGRIQTQ